MKIEYINGIPYYNVLGLYHRVQSEDEIQQLAPEQQGLERLAQNIAQQVLENEQSRKESK